MNEYFESIGCTICRDMNGPVDSVNGRVRIAHTIRKENLHNFKNLNISIFKVFDDVVRFAYWN